MISAVRHMLTAIYAQIPNELLDLAFDGRGRKSLDEEIIEKIIQTRLVVDCSAMSGQYKEITLDPKWAMASYIDQINAPNVTIPYVVYKIPPEAREHRSIVDVMELSLPYGSMSSIAMMGGAFRNCGQIGINAGSFADQAINGITGQSDLLLPTPILLNGSQVKLTPMEYGIMQSYTLILKCRLEYDKDFTNMPTDAVIQLTELGLLATKSYIYTNLIIKLDMGYVRSGQEIGKIRELVESYADADEKYTVQLQAFQGAMDLDINTLYERILQGINF